MVQRLADDLQRLLIARVEECRRLITDFDAVLSDGPQTEIVSAEPGRLSVITRWNPGVVRPGGTWSGPSQFEIVDTVGFLLTMSALPPHSDALTIAINMQFLSAPPAEDILAEARTLRITPRTSSVVVELKCASVEGLVAHATASYVCRTT